MTYSTRATLRSLACTTLLVLAPGLASAQVGHLPSESPFRDVNQRSRISLLGGWFVGAKDEAGVLPQSGPMLTGRFDTHVGGPADVSFRLGYVSSERNVLDPTRSAGARLVEVRDVTLGFAEIGLAFSLTGAKSWHNLMPTLHGGVGLISDFKGTDGGGFKHGTQFSVGYGLGMRYVPPDARLALRAELGSVMYSLEYPLSYYTPTSDGTSVLTQRVKRSQWRNNWVLSVGATYWLFR